MHTDTVLRNSAACSTCSAWAWPTRWGLAPGPSIPTTRRPCGPWASAATSSARCSGRCAAMHGESREPAVFEPGDDGRTIMGRVAEGLWKVPSDLPEQGRRYDAQRLSGVAVELKSHPTHRAAGPRDRRDLAGPAVDRWGRGLGDLGFGSEVKEALHKRAGFLVEQGLLDHLEKA